jgi:hypothetical protein
VVKILGAIIRRRGGKIEQAKTDAPAPEVDEKLLGFFSQIVRP